MARAASINLSTAADLAWKPRHSPWLITGAVMAATVLEVLDTSVANVALPHIAGNLSATPEEATWVLTSYLVANAIVLPITAWCSALFGRKRFLLTCITIFTLSSAACGMATSLNMLVLARIIQGAGGGALQPLSQAILLESFPPRKRGAAMAAFGMGVVVAPIIGPTLGGWITDHYSWRWVFYLNLPIGLGALWMVRAFVEDPPYIRRAGAALKGGIDYIGFGFMALWLATLQIVLDRGQQEDWFGAVWIRWFTGISAVAFVAFLVWELSVDQPMVNLRVLRHRNFAVGTVMIGMVGVVLYGTTALLPLFLQGLMGYSALDSGLALSPRGIGAVLALIVVGRLIGKIDARLLIVLGFTGLTLTSWMLSRIYLGIAIDNVIWPNVFMGVAMGFVFVPLTTMAMGDLANEEMGHGSGLYNLMRNLGGSIGISVVTTFLARGAQQHQVYLASHVDAYNPVAREQLRALGGALTPQSGPLLAQQQALGLVQHTVQAQSALWAYVDNFRLLAGMCLLCVPLVLLFHRPKHLSRSIAAH